MKEAFGDDTIAKKMAINQWRKDNGIELEPAPAEVVAQAEEAVGAGEGGEDILDEVADEARGEEEVADDSTEEETAASDDDDEPSPAPAPTVSTPAPAPAPKPAPAPPKPAPSFDDDMDIFDELDM